MKLFMLLPNITYSVLMSWNVGLFLKKCPECGHMLSRHLKRADGSFQD